MDKYICHFDGACYQNNPGGTMGVGATIQKETNTGLHGWEMQVGYPIEADPANSNNLAEYLALQFILYQLEGVRGSYIEIRGDSQLVVMQMDNVWKIKGGLYKSIAIECKGRMEMLRAKNAVVITWIPREFNYTADLLSKSEKFEKTTRKTPVGAITNQIQIK